MGNAAKEKGNRRERQVRDIFTERGYDVVKSGGSLGIFDLVCVSKRTRWELIDSNRGHPRGRTLAPSVVLVQVKSNRISSAEVSEIANHETTGEKQIWIKKDRKPWMMAVIP